MVPVFTLLFILGISIIVTRVATVALTHTGISKQMARFQARSAFTGCGYTTSESEQLVRHPVRRRIVLMLMLLGNVGIVSVLASLVLSFLGDHYVGWTGRLGILVGGIGFLWWFASSRTVDRVMSRLIDRALRRWTDLEIRDYSSVLRLAENYDVVELEVEEDDWMAQQTLADLALRDEGVIVLGIGREDGTYLGAPNGDTRLLAGDVVTLYGCVDTLAELDERRRDAHGEARHRAAVREQEERVEREKAQDRAATEGDGDARSATGDDGDDGDDVRAA